MNRIYLSGLLSALLCINPVAADELGVILKRTLETHPDAQISRHKHRMAEQDYRQARAGYLPTVDIQLGYGREHSDNSTTRQINGGDIGLNREEAGININQMLFDGFKVSNETERQQQRRRAAARNVQDSSENIALRTAEVYLDVLRNQHLLELAKDNLVVHQKTLEQVRLLVDSGAGRRADVQQTEGRLALATSTMLRNEGDLRDAEFAYLRVTGETPQALVLPERAQATRYLPASLAELLERAKRQHPALQSAQANVDASQAAYDASKAAFMPRVDLQLGATKNHNLDGVEGANDDVSAMLQLRYNLYRGGADIAKRGASAEQLSISREVLRRTERAVEEEARMAWNALQTTQQRIEHLREHVRASEAVVDSYTQQFKLGQRTLLDLLDARFELYNGRTALVGAEYAELFTLYRVLSSCGQLLASFESGESADDTATH